MKKIIKKLLLFAVPAIIALILFTACGDEPEPTPIPEPTPTPIPINEAGMTVKDRFVPPDGYTRVVCDEGTFGAYIQNFKLKEYGVQPLYYNGNTNGSAGGLIGVFDQDVTQYQQCADSCMRLWAEYNFENGRYDRISFDFVNGFKCDYSRWAEGYRVKVTGNNCEWVKKAEADYSYESLTEYLEFVYLYANTESLQGQLLEVGLGDVQVGDVFVITAYQMDSSLGHAVFVADMCENENGDRLYLIFEGTTPASQMALAYSITSPYGYWVKLDTDNTLSITKNTFDDDLQDYIDKTWTCPGIYARRFF